MPRSLEGLADSVNRDVLLAHGNDCGADGVTFWGAVGSFARLDEEGAVGVLAERVASHAETTGRIAQALGDLMRGEARNNLGTERLVLPMGWISRFEEDARELCKLVSFTVKQSATLLSM